MKKSITVPGQVLDKYDFDGLGIRLLGGEEKEVKVYFSTVIWSYLLTMIQYLHYN